MGLGLGVGSAGDLAADDEVGSAIGEGLGGGGDAFLVAGVLTGGTNAWGNEDFVGAGEGADGAGLERGADKTVDTGGDALADALADEVADGSFLRVAEIAEVFFAEAGENGDAEDLEWGAGFTSDGGGHDLGVGMDGEKVDTERGGAADGAADGFGDVVEFQIEEDFFLPGEHGVDDRGAFGGEEFEADFVEIDGIAELINEVEGLAARFDVESDNDGVMT